MPNNRLAVKSHNYVSLSRLRDAMTDTVPDVDTVTCQLKTLQGDNIGDPITMDPKSGSSDEYVGIIPPEVELVENSEVVAEVTAVTTGGVQRTWLQPVVVRSY